MSHPHWVLKHKVKGTEIKKISNKYYLYKISSRWDPVKKRSKKITLGYIGAITQKGLIYASDKKKIRDHKLSTRSLEFGASHILASIGEDILIALKKLFREEALPIFIIAILRIIENASFKNIKPLFDESYLSVLFPDTSIGPNQISSLIKTIGSKRDKILEFFKSFISADSHFLFDATNISSHSNLLEINHPGYDANKNFINKVKLLYVFSFDNKSPNYYRIIPGNIHEISAFKLSLDEIKLNNAVIIADKGFSSNSNIDKLKENNLKFIIPLKRNDSNIDYSIYEPKDCSLFDGNFRFKNRTIWYKEHSTDNYGRIILYYDDKLATSEKQDYLNRIESNCEGYSLESFFKKNTHFGSFAVTTNMVKEQNSKKIYECYKGRSEVEQFFDTLKNTLEGDKTYMRGEKEMEAWFFINHISMMLYYRLFSLLRKNDLTQKYSPKDIIKYSKQIRKMQFGKSWVTSEISTKIAQLFTKFNLAIT